MQIPSTASGERARRGTRYDAAMMRESAVAMPPEAEKNYLRHCAGLSLVAAVLFSAFVYAYRFVGEDFLAAIDRNVGDTLLSEARNLEAAGRIDDAIAHYREAADGSFSDPKVAFWCLRDLGRLLVQSENLAEGIEALSRAYEIDPSDPAALNLLCSAHMKDGDAGEVERIARERIAASPPDPAVEALAHFHLGQALEANSDTDGALAAYMQSAAIDATGPSAYHAAVILERRNRLDEAKALLDGYLPHATGWRIKWANLLNERISRTLEK